MDRRQFVFSAALALPWSSGIATAATPQWRVGVIGDTGRGKFGHGLDGVWLRIPETTIAAVADADAAGLDSAKQRLGVERGFRDYREMLIATCPDLVAVCPRHADQHRDMILAAVAAGAKGIYVEKPFCRSPREADEIRAACEDRDVKLAVAHRNRWHPTLAVIDRLIADGEIGNVLELRGRGKGDRRGGGEDLWVLGSHVLNLIHCFGGDPIDCSAVLLQDGRPVDRSDVRPGNEGLGPLAGNEIHARYRMKRGPIAYFDSIADEGTGDASFGLQIVGSEGIINLHCDRDPIAHLCHGNPFAIAQPRTWLSISTAGVDEPEPREDLADSIKHHVIPVRDLIAAVKNHRQPLCDVHEAAMTVEMICAAFESHRQAGRAVTLPLVERDNPLQKL